MSEWLNIRTQKPIDGQRVLVWHSRLAAIDKRSGASMSSGIRIGHYIEDLDELRPEMSIGFKCEWWMPLPEPPPRKRPNLMKRPIDPPVQRIDVAKILPRKNDYRDRP